MIWNRIRAIAGTQVISNEERMIAIQVVDCLNISNTKTLLLFLQQRNCNINRKLFFFELY